MHVELEQIHDDLTGTLMLSLCLLLRTQFCYFYHTFGIRDTLELVIGTLFRQVHAQVLSVWIKEPYRI